MLSDPIIAIIRTIVPTFVGSLIAFLASHSIAVDAATQQSIAALGVAIITALYYALATWLERNVNPNFGWMLGAPHAPSYPTTTTTTPADPVLPEEGDIQPEDPPQDQVKDL